MNPSVEFEPVRKRGRKKKSSSTPEDRVQQHIPISESFSPLLYDLCGVVCHKGESLSQGHYISFVRSDYGWEHKDDLLPSPTEEGSINKKRKAGGLLEVKVPVERDQDKKAKGKPPKGAPNLNSVPGKIDERSSIISAWMR